MLTNLATTIGDLPWNEIITAIVALIIGLFGGNKLGKRSGK